MSSNKKPPAHGDGSTPSKTHSNDINNYQQQDYQGETKSNVVSETTSDDIVQLDSTTLNSFVAPQASPEISTHFAHQLFHGSYTRIWFRFIFDFLRPNQLDRIELRSLCKFFSSFRDNLLRCPSQIYTCFPHRKHATWESLIEAVNATWDKDPTKAPTLILVGRGDEEMKEQGHYVPYFKLTGITGNSYYKRCFLLRQHDCSTPAALFDIVRENVEQGVKNESGESALHSLTLLLNEKEKWSALIPLLRRLALLIQERQGDTLNVTSNLGYALKAAGQLDEAEPLLQQALEGYERVAGMDSPITLIAANNLGSLYKAAGRLEEAETLLRRSFETSERVVGVTPVHALNFISNLGSLLQKQGKLEEAELLLRRARDVSERDLGLDDMRTLNSISNLGVLLQKQENYEEAETLFQHDLVERERMLGSFHPDTLHSVGILGALLLQQGRLNQAEPLLRRALEGREHVLGCEHPKTLISANDLGLLLKRQGMLDAAEKLLRRALEVSKRVSGLFHPTTQISMNNLAVLLEMK